MRSVWDFIDEVVARGFCTEAKLSLAVSQRCYEGEYRTGISQFVGESFKQIQNHGIWGINLYTYQAICLSLPPRKPFSEVLNF